jgi:predicted TIM-barrel fold metal-dependent hydrolase
MIVDVHTHIPSHMDAVPEDEIKFETTSRSGEKVYMTNSIDDYLRDMGPVDKSFLFGIAPRPWRPDQQIMGPVGWDPKYNHNDVAAETAKRDPGKIVPFMSLHPLDPNWKNEYDRCIGDLGSKGIKLGPNYQDFDPTGPEAFELFARLEADGIPIIFHQGTSGKTEAPLTYAHPLTTDKIAMAFPNLTMVLAHLGHPWQVDCLAVVRKHPNVWADVSAQFYRPYSFWQGMRLFYEWGVTDKILFASDWPVTLPQDNMDHLRGLTKFAKDHHLPDIPEDEIEGIINRDSVEILRVG